MKRWMARRLTIQWVPDQKNLARAQGTKSSSFSSSQSREGEEEDEDEKEEDCLRPAVPASGFFQNLLRH